MRYSPPSPFNFAFASEKSITTSSPSRNVLPFGRLNISNGLLGSTFSFGSSGLAGAGFACLDSARKTWLGGGLTNVVAVVCAFSLAEQAEDARTSAKASRPNCFLKLYMLLWRIHIPSRHFTDADVRIRRKNHQNSNGGPLL